MENYDFVPYFIGNQSIWQNDYGIKRYQQANAYQPVARIGGRWVIERVIYAEIPPRVEYFLTDKGKSLLPIFNLMKDWGMENIISKRAEAA